MTSNDAMLGGGGQSNFVTEPFFRKFFEKKIFPIIVHYKSPEKYQLLLCIANLIFNTESLNSIIQIKCNFIKKNQRMKLMTI